MTITSSSRRCASLLFLTLWLAPLAASAEDVAAYRSHAKKGQVYFNSGQYQKAIEEFQQAYEAKPEPLLLWNLAQAHKYLGHHKDALMLYERYLRLVPNSELRAETEGYMAESRAALETERAAREKEQREKEEAERRERAQAAVEQSRPAPPPPVMPALVRQPERPRVRPLKVAKWVVGAAGLLAAAAGGALLALDGRPTCQKESEAQKYCPYELDTLVPGAATLGGGGALLVTSAVLFGVDYRQSRTEKTALLTVSGRF